MTDIVGKLWGFRHTLRHDGIDYGVVGFYTKPGSETHRLMPLPSSKSSWRISAAPIVDLPRPRRFVAA